MYICIHVYTRISIYKYRCINIHTHAHTPQYGCVCVSVRVFSSLFVWVGVFLRACVHVCVCVCLQEYQKEFANSTHPLTVAGLHCCNAGPHYIWWHVYTYKNICMIDTCCMEMCLCTSMHFFPHSVLDIM